MKLLLPIVLILSSCAIGYASDCRVIEYSDRNEVICEGILPITSTNNNQIKEILIQKEQLQNKIKKEEGVRDEAAIKIREKNEEIELLKKKFAEDNKRFNERYGR